MTTTASRERFTTSEIPSMTDLLVFDVAKYQPLFELALSKLGSREEAKKVLNRAIVNDGYGLITEKISGEKDASGNYIFDDLIRAKLQLTPPEHTYFQATHSETGEKYLTAPEYLFVEKDVLSGFSSW